MILRDHDANTAWASQADGTLESRTYICQNWRADVVALMTSGGELINQVRYDPYGVPFGIAKADLDADGDVDNDDTTLFNTYYTGGTHPYADWNWDGTVDASDAADFLSDKNADTGLGRGDPGYAWSHAGGALRKAYAGYEIDPVLTGAEGWESLYHVRHRVYLSQLGRWTRRDPLGYVDGINLYTYARLSPATNLDPSGLNCVTPYYPLLWDEVYGEVSDQDVFKRWPDDGSNVGSREVPGGELAYAWGSRFSIPGTPGYLDIDWFWYQELSAYKIKDGLIWLVDLYASSVTKWDRRQALFFGTAGEGWAFSDRRGMVKCQGDKPVYKARNGGGSGVRDHAYGNHTARASAAGSTVEEPYIGWVLTVDVDLLSEFEYTWQHSSGGKVSGGIQIGIPGIPGHGHVDAEHGWTGGTGGNRLFNHNNSPQLQWVCRCTTLE